MVTLLGPVLVIAGFALYMATTSRGRFRRVPWEVLAVSGLGFLLSLTRVLAGPTAGGIAAVLASGLVLGFMGWLFFVKSMYAEREDRPRVGDRFPDFRLPSSNGEVYDSASMRGKRHLLIFYRGSW